MHITESAGTVSEEVFVFHSTSVMLHFTQASMLDEFGNVNVMRAAPLRSFFHVFMLLNEMK